MTGITLECVAARRLLVSTQDFVGYDVVGVKYATRQATSSGALVDSVHNNGNKKSVDVVVEEKEW